ncbi:MAG TPA: dihydrolipoamide acetyltransferase family protein [Arenicellales bacterium]|nr:dihydrolipoamide acetyltransferase family protein [Arenicellales bacterium]
MAEFLMPSLGADMESGTLVEWKVSPGDEVQRNEIVAVVETAKGAIDIEIFEDGVIDELLASRGQEVPVGEPLAIYHRPGEIAPSGAEKRTAEGGATPPPPPPTGGEAPGPEKERIEASPVARRRARELGIALEQVQGTGPQGAVVLADVEAAAGPAKEVPARREATPPTAAERMREAIGAAMARSKREIPHYYLGADIRLTRAMDWLERENPRRGLERRLIPAAFLYRAVVLALQRVPALNGHWNDGEPVLSKAVHLGVAISLKKRGLIAPALMHADELSLDELMTALHDLIQRARTGGLRASELSAPTVTVTNLGDRGVDTAYPVIYPPQLAIVGFGRIGKRVVAEGDAVAVRPVVTATMAGDHRATDGYHGSKLLNEIDKCLQSPEEL